MPPLPCTELNQEQRDDLLRIARRSIEQGFDTQIPLQVELSEYAPALREPAAVFITLTRAGELRGCIGSLEVRDPLAQAIATSAWNSAFRDSRFEPLQRDELEQLCIEVSILSPMETLHPDSRARLLQILRPGIDGLWLEDAGRRATFLPKVWDKIGSAEAFVEQLLLKAGFAADYWSDSMCVRRYSTLTFAEF